MNDPAHVAIPRAQFDDLRTVLTNTVRLLREGPGLGTSVALAGQLDDQIGKLDALAAPPLPSGRTIRRDPLFY